jgi:hypothetical protein
VHALYEAIRTPGIRESAHVRAMKKFTNQIGLGVEPTGKFLHEIRRVSTAGEFFGICAEFLDHDRPLALEPYALALKPSDVLAGENQ